MSTLVDGLRDAIHLIATGDPALLRSVRSTLHISLEATALAAIAGIPLGCLAALGPHRRHRALRTSVNAGLRLPPVVVGQFLWLLMWPDSRWGAGPLAGLDWIYTTSAVILAQTLLALPLIAALVARGVDDVEPALLDQARALGAGRLAIARLALREARPAVIAAILAGFGTAVATVGAILVVGTGLGELTLATSALTSWNSGGADAHAVASGLILLGLFTVVAAVATPFQHRRSPWAIAQR